MKKILSVISFLFVAAVGYAQTPNIVSNPMTGRIYDFRNFATFDSAAFFGKNDTTWKPQRQNAFIVDSNLNKIALWNGGKWHLLAMDPVITLPAGDSVYTIPAGVLLEKIEIIEPTSIYVNIGSTVSASDLIEGIPVTTGHANFAFNYYAATTKTIYFGNFTPSTIIKIYQR